MQRLRAMGGQATWRAVKAYVEGCVARQRFKAAKPAIPMGVLEEVSDVKDIWSVDFIGPLKPAEEGVQYIFLKGSSLQVPVEIGFEECRY